MAYSMEDTRIAMHEEAYQAVMALKDTSCDFIGLERCHTTFLELMEVSIMTRSVVKLILTDAHDLRYGPRSDGRMSICMTGTVSDMSGILFLLSQHIAQHHCTSSGCHCKSTGTDSMYIELTWGS